MSVLRWDGNVLCWFGTVWWRSDGLWGAGFGGLKPGDERVTNALKTRDEAMSWLEESARERGHEVQRETTNYIVTVQHGEYSGAWICHYEVPADLVVEFCEFVDEVCQDDVVLVAAPPVMTSEAPCPWDSINNVYAPAAPTRRWDPRLSALAARAAHERVESARRRTAEASPLHGYHYASGLALELAAAERIFEAWVKP